MSCCASKHRGRPGNAPAFTLIEVMVSIAIVLVLIIGVNQVFKITADTVGAGQALSAKIRDGRAAQAVFTNELAHLAPDGPFLIINSHTTVAFRNSNDAKGDLDGNPLTIDIDGNNKEGETLVPGEIVNLATPTDRNHRVDLLSFFTRDLYPRQTGGIASSPNPVYIAPESSNEAWVTYGHLRIYDQKSDPDVNGSYPNPGSMNGTNIGKNYYADDWILGRVVMLMSMPQLDSVSGTLAIKDRNDKNQIYWQQVFTPTSPLPPLQTSTLVNDGSTPVTITDARYDLVGTSISSYRALLANYILHSKYNTGGVPATPAVTTTDDWWTLLPVTSQTFGGRFRCNPYPVKPLDPRKVAQTVPALMNNCTQFIVEFAGDYLTQGNPATGDTSSDIKAFAPDGQIDYYYEHPNGATGPAIRHIRWYGFPRNVNGSGPIPGPLATPPTGISKYDNMVGVIPLRDALMSATSVVPAFNYLSPPTPNPDAFERHMSSDISPAPGIALKPEIDYADPATGVQSGEYYTAAWGPNDTNRPKMIRIIVTVDDPNGRLGVGQTYEYVINLP